jgi:hypothetical protein
MSAAAGLAGCGNIDSGPEATPEAVARAAYVHDGPPALTLYTMINNRSGHGAHTSLMINASQRVIWDPSGSVRFSTVPEIGDVLYGITPAIAEAYASAHARITYHVRIQTLEVPAEVAERAMRLAMVSGPVGMTACTSSTAAILRQLPGLEGIRPTLFPNALAAQFAELPLSEDRRLFENDSDDKDRAIALYEGRRR